MKARTIIVAVVLGLAAGMARPRTVRAVRAACASRRLLALSLAFSDAAVQQPPARHTRRLTRRPMSGGSAGRSRVARVTEKLMSTPFDELAATLARLSPQELEQFEAMVVRMRELRRHAGVPNGMSVQQAIDMGIISAEELEQARWGTGEGRLRTQGDRAD
jgi:hypothetical protein